MKIITAPNEYVRSKYDIFCFLAGGITNCRDWQKEVIEELSKCEPIPGYELVIFNPRRENFPIDDPTASKKQIAWEFKYLEQCDIFSMYFCAGESDQPICMYELGRNLVRMNEKQGIKAKSIITIEEGYKRAADVDIQSSLTGTNFYYNLIHSGEDGSYRHAHEIYELYNVEAYDRDMDWMGE